MSSSRRRLRELGVVAVVVALVVGIVVVAAQADGRRTARARTNDGGAWLINARAGVVGHLNRGVGEITGTVEGFAEPGDAIDTEQDDDLVVVTNDTSDTLTVIDPRNFQATATLSTPDHLNVRVDGARILAWTESPLRVWDRDLIEIAELDELDELEPTISSEADGLAQLTRFGTLLAVAPETSTLYRLTSAGDAVVEQIDVGGIGQDIVELSASGDNAIMRTASGALLTLPAGDDEMSTQSSMAGLAALAQPSLPTEPVVGIADDGTLFSISSGDDGIAIRVGTVEGQDPLPPLLHDGCVFVVTTRPAALTKSCDGAVVESAALEGTTGTSLRLRLVNEWVWINDLATGATWVASADAELDRIDDWGAVLATSDGDGDESDDIDGDNVEQRENPDGDDALVIQADEIDEDGVNEPPVARPDTIATRTDLPVIVPVLRNDEDADGDVLLVTEVTAAADGALIEPTGDRQAIQVTPRAGSDSPISFTYTISDGRGASASADVKVIVKPITAPNQDPVAVTDVVTARAGSAASINVLDNDSDPDGDSIVLVSVDAPGGIASFDGSGQVTFEPDPSSDRRTLLVDYTIRDTLGATATGMIRVAVRLAESNSEPDARNDSAVTTVGRPVSFNVLLNDTDPDDDAINVSGPPTLLEPSNVAAVVDYTLSSDGQMFFVSDTPGEHILRYSISDGSESDSALIRVDVDPAEVNRPPVAVRDDVTIPRGGSATVYALLNDSDPDGDVVAFDRWIEPDFTKVQAFRDVGLTIDVADDAPDRLVVRYSITDGLSDPTSGVIVVAVTDTTAVNQAPILRRDVIEVRPGGSSSARPLLNDFDPEGGVLALTNVSEVEDVRLQIGPLGQEILVTLGDSVTSGFTFSYEVTDEGGLTAAEFVDVRIVPDGDANRPPIARPDSARTRAQQAVTIAVLNNDSDPDGDVLRLESMATQPANGSAVVNDDSTISYTPASGFSGTDRFQYVIVDEFGDQAIGDVLVGVVPTSLENRPPSAVDDAITVAVGADPVRLAVLDNDFDPDGDALSIIRVSNGPAVELSNDAQAIVFTPPAGIERPSVTVTFTYRVADGRGGEADAEVTVTVEQVVEPQAPVALPDVVGPVREGTSVSVPVLDNDLDPDGRRSELIVRSVDGAGQVGTDGSITFVAGLENSIHTYSITDADQLSSTSTVEILVTENVAPTVETVVATTPFETPIDIDLSASIADADGDDLFVVCCDSTRNGSFERLTSGPNVYTLRFTPDTGFAGEAGFSFQVDDQRGHQIAGATVITVEPKENEAPVALDESASVEAGTTGTIALRPLVDDVDLATGDELTLALVGSPGPGISFADGVVSVVADIDAAGQIRTFDYTVTDSEGESATATVSIEITESTIPPPLAVGDTAQTTQGVAVTVDVVANDVDERGDGLRVVAAGSTTAIGSITFDETAGTVTLAPSGDFFGTAQVSYTIEDARRTEAGRATGSIEVDVIGLPGIVPTPQAVADNATATVTWGQPAANGGPIEEFELESDQGQQILLGPSSSHTFNGLTNGVELTFRVRARNEAGWGEWSAPSAPVTPDIQPGRPGAPTVLFGDGELTVNWSEPANEGSALTKYILEIGGELNSTVELPPNPSYTWTGLTNGVNSQFRVIAENASGRSDVSAWSTAEHPLREPDQPAPIDAQRGNGYLDLTWTAPADNGDPITSYQVQMESDQANPTTTVTPGFRWANLPNGVFQRFRTRARNRDADWGQWSAWSNSEKPCNVPDAAAAPGATRGDTEVDIAWTAPADNGCSITGYTIEAIGTGLTRTAPAGATSLTFAGLTNGTSYTFRVTATNDFGVGTAGVASAAVIPAGPPMTPTGLTATPTNTSGGSSYSFTAPNNNGDAITSYRLQINGAGSEAATVGNVAASSPTGTRNGLSENTGYFFAVQACNSVGCGPFSSSSGFTTFGPPSTPGGFTISEITGALRWNWSSVPANGSGLYYDFGWFDSQGNQLTAIVGTALSYTWNDGINWRYYEGQIRACNDLGCSPWTALRGGTVRPNVRFEAGWGDWAGCGNFCNYTRPLGQRMRPLHNYFMRCFDSTGQFGSQNITSDANGEFFVNLSGCIYNTSGESVYVTATDEFGVVYTSNTFLWIP